MNLIYISLARHFSVSAFDKKKGPDRKKVVAFSFKMILCSV